MKNSAGDASRSSEPTRRPAGGPSTDAAAPAAASADEATSKSALRPAPSSTTRRSTPAAPAPTQVPAAGGPSTDAAAPAAASADEATSKSALRPAPSSTTRRSTPAAPAPTQVPAAGGPSTKAAAPAAALADVTTSKSALRPAPSSTTRRSTPAAPAPTQVPAAGGPSTDAAAPAAASADEAPSKSALRPAPSITTRRSTPAAPAPTIVPSRARSVRFAEDETTPPRPARLLSSAERLDLIKERPDLDVRDMPWYLRKLARKSAAKKRTPKMRKVAPPAEAAAGHVEDADATSNPPAPSSKKPSSSCPNSAPSKVTAPSSSMPKGVNAASEPTSKPTKALDIDTIKGWTRDRSAIVDVKRPRYDAIAAAAADPLAPRLAPAAAPELAAVVARLHGGDGASARAALPVNRRGAEAAPPVETREIRAVFPDGRRMFVCGGLTNAARATNQLHRLRDGTWRRLHVAGGWLELVDADGKIRARTESSKHRDHLRQRIARKGLWSYYENEEWNVAPVATPKPKVAPKQRERPGSASAMASPDEATDVPVDKATMRAQVAAYYGPSPSPPADAGPVDLPADAPSADEATAAAASPDDGPPEDARRHAARLVEALRRRATKEPDDKVGMDRYRALLERRDKLKSCCEAVELRCKALIDEAPRCDQCAASGAPLKIGSTPAPPTTTPRPAPAALVPTRVRGAPVTRVDAFAALSADLSRLEATIRVPLAQTTTPRPAPAALVPTRVRGAPVTRVDAFAALSADLSRLEATIRVPLAQTTTPRPAPAALVPTRVRGAPVTRVDAFAALSADLSRLEATIRVPLAQTTTPRPAPAALVPTRVRGAPVTRVDAFAALSADLSRLEATIRVPLAQTTTPRPAPAALVPTRVRGAPVTRVDAFAALSADLSRLEATIRVPLAQTTTPRPAPAALVPTRVRGAPVTRVDAFAALSADLSRLEATIRVPLAQTTTPRPAPAALVPTRVRGAPVTRVDAFAALSADLSRLEATIRVPLAQTTTPRPAPAALVPTRVRGAPVTRVDAFAALSADLSRLEATIRVPLAQTTTPRPAPAALVPTRVRGAPVTRVDAFAALSADLSRLEATIRVPLAQTTTPRPAPAALVPTRVRGAPVTRVDAFAALSADLSRLEATIRVPLAQTTTPRPAPAALVPTRVQSSPPTEAAAGRGSRTSMTEKADVDGMLSCLESAVNVSAPPARHDRDDDKSSCRRSCRAALLRRLCNLFGDKESQSSKLCGGSAHAPDQQDHFGAAPPAVVVIEQPIAASSGDALVIEEFAFSVAQCATQASVPKPGPTTPRAYRDAYEHRDVFYKDATPKAEHFMQFRVTLPKSLQNVISGDAPRVVLKLLAVNDSGDVVRCHIGLSSSDQGGQRFVIQASIPREEAQRCGSPPVEPAYTPSVFVKGPFKKPRGRKPPWASTWDSLTGQWREAPGKQRPPPKKSPEQLKQEMQDRIRELERDQNSGYNGMTAAEFATKIHGYPDGCKAWCSDGQRNKYRVIMYGWNDDEVLSSAKGERQLAAWKASKETFKETLKEHSRAETKPYVPAETPRDQTQAGCAAATERRIARDEARDEKTVLSSDDSPRATAARIKAVKGGLEAFPSVRDRRIAELEKKKQELESDQFADDTKLRKIVLELAFLKRRGDVANKHQLGEIIKETHRIDWKTGDLINNVVAQGCLETKEKYAREVAADESKREASVVKNLDVLNQMKLGNSTTDEERTFWEEPMAWLEDDGAYADLWICGRDGNPRRATKEEIGMLAESHSGARRRAVTIRMFLRGELPFARPPVRQRVKLFKDLLRRAVADENTDLRLDDLVFLCTPKSDDIVFWAAKVLPLVRRAAPELGDDVAGGLTVHVKGARVDAGPAGTPEKRPVISTAGGRRREVMKRPTLVRHAATHGVRANLQTSSIVRDWKRGESGFLLAHDHQLAYGSGGFGVCDATDKRWLQRHARIADPKNEPLGGEGVVHGCTLQLIRDGDKRSFGLAKRSFVHLSADEQDPLATANVRTAYHPAAARQAVDFGCGALDRRLEARDSAAWSQKEVSGEDSEWSWLPAVLLDELALDKCALYARGCGKNIIPWGLALDQYSCAAFEEGAVEATAQLADGTRCSTKVLEFYEDLWLDDFLWTIGAETEDAPLVREVGPSTEAIDRVLKASSGCMVDALARGPPADIEVKTAEDGFSIVDLCTHGCHDRSRCISVLRPPDPYCCQLAIVFTRDRSDGEAPWTLENIKRTARRLQKYATDISKSGANRETLFFEMMAELHMRSTKLAIAAICEPRVIEVVTFDGTPADIKRRFAAAIQSRLLVANKWCARHGRLVTETYYAAHEPPTANEERAVFVELQSTTAPRACDDVARALGGDWTAKRVELVAETLADNRRGFLLKHDDGRFSVKRGATLPRLRMEEVAVAMTDDDEGGAAAIPDLRVAGEPAASDREPPWDQKFKVEKGDHATTVALEERALRRIDAGKDPNEESDVEEEESAETKRKKNSPQTGESRSEADTENTGAAKQQSPTKEGKRRRKRRGKGKGKGKGGGGALDDHDAAAGPPPPPDVLGRGA